MATSTPPPRSRSYSSLSIASTRTRPGPLTFSPMSASTSAQGYQRSIQSLSPTSSFRRTSLSGAASQAGSATTTTTTVVGGPTRFKRGHARKQAAMSPVVVPSMNPDELDLMALEDPDEVFRLFGVRDVTGLEKRAREAAAAKVADLRTMVGERYRDLLSAADSIVRMRGAAEKLVQRLDRVESEVEDVAGTRASTTSKRDLKSPVRTVSPEMDRTLASSPALSLTIHLFLSLPSLVHSLLESSAFLPAARLEGIGRVLYRELSNYSSDGSQDPGHLKDSFPIVERQWENVGSLGAVIARRATADLRIWETDAITIAETLAAILILENASVPSTLSLLLDARSKTLSTILSAPSPKPTKHKHVDVDAVLASLEQVLGIVLKTVEVATSIFGASSTTESSPGLLLHLLHQIETPTSTPSSESSTLPQISPILSTLPNFPLLARHLPPSILDFTPFLSISASRNTLSLSTAQSEIQSWLTKETDRVVAGIESWIMELRGGARTLAQVRTVIRRALAGAPVTASADEASLRSRLELVIENRLAVVYEEHLKALISRVSPCLSTLLAALPSSRIDLDPAYFMFETPLPFPSPSNNALSARPGHADPFDKFLEQVLKRVDGRSPLIDRGLGEIEAHARDLREDLECWLGGAEGETVEGDSRIRLREQYIHSARATLDGVFRELSTVLDSISTDVNASLFVGNFTSMLSKSTAFTRDLLLASASVPKSQEAAIIAEWQDRLTELQSRSLSSWRTRVVDQAVGSIQESMTIATASTPAATAWAWEHGLSNGASSSPVLPTQPSSSVLFSLRVLVAAIRQIGPHRTKADFTIVQTLVTAFEEAILPIAQAFVPSVKILEGPRKGQVAAQCLWDLVFLRRFWGDGAKSEWATIEGALLKLIAADESTPSSLDLSTLQYLQRTQTIFFCILPRPVAPSTRADGHRLLPWGAPAGTEFKASVGVVQPRARLGLLRSE